jgi:prepilin peptidase CpaA
MQRCAAHKVWHTWILIVVYIIIRIISKQCFLINKKTGLWREWMISTSLHILYNTPIRTTCILLFVLGAVFFDIRQRRIPNWLVASALMVALLLQIQSHSVLAWVAGMVVGFLLFLPGYLSRQMGAGDVKLMAAMGAFFNAGVAFKIGLSAYLIGGGYALIWMAWQRDCDAWRQYLKFRLHLAWMLIATKSGNPLTDQGLSKIRPKAASIPYSVPIALAVMCALFMNW